jgi:hypothetical protein
MTTITNRKTISLLCVAAILGSSAIAYADPVLTIPRGVTLRKSATKATATVNSQVRAHNAPASGSLTNAAALSAFRVKFDNGDHALRSINVVKQTDQTAGLWMSDSNGDDPISATGTWWVIPGATGGQLSTTISSGQEINFSVPAGPINHRLVLGGFSFNIGGTTSVVETGEVQLQRLAIRVRDPHPAASNSAVSRISGVVHTNDGNRPISVTVQYVWVPDSYISGGGIVTNQSPRTESRARVRNRDQAVGQMPTSERYLIESFDFQYTNGPHNMLGLGVHLNGTDGATTEAVTWQDNNRDDPIAWSVSYLQMR